MLPGFPQMRAHVLVLALFGFVATTYSSGGLADGLGIDCQIDHESAEHRPQGEGAEPSDDQDRAREALDRHEIKPLPEVFAAAALAQPGEVVGVKLECKARAWVYELRIIGKDRRRRDVYVNATTLDVTRDD